MNTILRIFVLSLLFTTIYNCTSDDGNDYFKYDHAFNTVGFMTNYIRMEEGSEITVEIKFNEPAETDGVITILGSDLKNLEIIGATVIDENALQLNFNKNTTILSFNINRADDNTITENIDPILTIKNITRPIYINSYHSLQLDISDDELSGLPKSYVTYNGNNLQHKVSYFYNISGRLAKVNYFYGNTNLHEHYKYDDQGKLVTILTNDDTEDISKTTFLWENGLIKNSTTEFMNPDSQSLNYKYTYNQNNQIIEKISSGNEPIEKNFYSYYSGDNIKSIDSYYGEELYFSTTFYTYTEKPNQFPEWDIIPTHRVQSQLPISLKTGYTGGWGPQEDVNYIYAYDDLGNLRSRRSNNGITYYYYY
ncbi:hypothetical protein [Aegicerativicinus sediminis]|uniref:hypothetical protein n=1 Tax=Aegicerativicinus sediminis TaxID=2893202 RepID=UPI001E61DCCD|nr:hypothetical protein [Aegicerativicinus sediminis]